MASEKRFNAIDRFEIRARVFRRATGYWPPGKDAPAAMALSDEDRAQASRAFLLWNNRHGEIVDHVIAAVEEHLKLSD